MKRVIVSTVLVLFCFVLQCTVFKAISFGGIVPNMMIVLAASFGFMRGERTGLLFGFFCGLLCDIFFGQVLGLYAMIYMYIGYLNGKFNRAFYPEDIKLPMVLILVSDLLYGLSCYFVFFMLRGRFHIGYYFINIILPEMVYTILVTMILYPIILWIHKKLEDSEQRSARKFV